jgi:hypothetical protein
MVEHIVVLHKVLSKVGNPFYIYWGWPGRLLFIPPWHLATLATSRDCSHITWFRRNSASVTLLATLSHRTWIAGDFSSSQLSQKRSKLSDCIFWKFSYKRKFFFLIHLLYAKSALNTDRKLYKKRWCDLMRTWSFSSYWCELDRLAFTEIESRLHFLKFVVQAKEFLSDSFCVRGIGTQRWSKVI